MHSDTEILGYLKDHSRSRRWLGLGARPEDLFAAFSRIERLEDWSREFQALAQRFEDHAPMADPALQATLLQLAALYYHIASLGLFQDSPERIRAYRSVVRVYDRLHASLRIPAERVEYAHDGCTFSGYLRRPPGRARPWCVLLLRGIDATREVELHTISDFLLEKGFATFAMDVAGQGESRFAGVALAPDISTSVSAALDALEGRGQEPGFAGMAIVGQSFGGYLAVTAAAGEPRIRACASLGGFYSLEDFNFGPLAQRNFMMNAKIEEAAYQEARKRFGLDGIIEHMACPFLGVNGSEDRVIPAEQTVKMYQRARGPKALKIYEGLPHCAYYDNKMVLFDVADWLREVLA